MGIEERDKHLAGLLGIETENKELDIPKEKNLPILQNSTLDQENLKIKNNLEKLYEEAEKVLQSSKDSATEFSTPRDIEVFARLLDSMRELQKQTMETNEKLYKEEEKSDDAKNVQNNFYIGNSRDLIDLIEKKYK